MYLAPAGRHVYSTRHTPNNQSPRGATCEQSTKDTHHGRYLYPTLYAHSQLEAVVRYIQNQEEHHSRRTFREEYLAFLKRFEVPYNPKYVFDSYDDAEHNTHVAPLGLWDIWVSRVL